MSRVARALARLVPAPALALALACGSCGRVGARTEAMDRAPLVVERGDLVVPVLLTGELAAAESRVLSAPQTETFELSIKWLAKDGAPVKQGDTLVEFDDTALLDEIGERELAVLEADNDWATARAKQSVDVAEKRFAALQARLEVAKTQIDADVPPEIVSRMQYSEYQIALGRAELGRDTTSADERVASHGAKLEDEIGELAYEKALRKYQAIEDELAALTVTAPQDGVMIVPDHPWEGRKLQVGDMVFPGFTIAELPDLSKMVVRAALSDVDDGLVHPGMKVSCLLDAHPDRPLSGLVRSVSPVAREPERGSTRRFFAVVIDLDETDPAIMRPGLSVQIAVESLRLTDVLLVPRVALGEGPEGHLAKLEDGSQVPVELGACNAHVCELRAGLSEGAVLARAPLAAPLALAEVDPEKGGAP